MSELIGPHGGTLVSRIVSGDEAKETAEVAKDLPRIDLDEISEADAELISIGGFSPLEGFMGRSDYDSVIDDCRLADGTVWPIPIVLPVDDGTAASAMEAGKAALFGMDGEILGVIEAQEVFERDVEREGKGVFLTTEMEHPGFAAIKARPGRCLAGRITLIREVPHDDYPLYRLKPAETRAAFEEKGWSEVTAFQTRNPIHRAHEYLTKVALEVSDGLLIHPLMGATKKGDTAADVRMKCYLALMEGYYPKERVMLSLLPAAMRYSGPREAILHAIMRQNYGCSKIIIGRDHAGVGSYYGSYDAQEIFDRFNGEELEIEPLRFEHSFYCKRCAGMASFKTCPHTNEDRIILSGTKVREMLSRGERPPAEFSRPEVADILIESMRESR